MKNFNGYFYLNFSKFTKILKSQKDTNFIIHISAQFIKLKLYVLKCMYTYKKISKAD